MSVATAHGEGVRGARPGPAEPAPPAPPASPMTPAMAALSDELAARLLALATANRELEAFSYTVSHDLRTPLTVIENYAYLLRTTDGKTLTPEGRKALEGIHAAIRRMSLIIQNILYMSRVTRMPLVRQPVDLAEAARQVLAELGEREPLRRVQVTAPPHLWAVADPAILRIALSNLLANAWKFSGQRPDAAIEVGQVPGRRPATYFVRDNGVGFDPQDQPRLFQLFQRLRPGEFEGTGIGLTTVARAVARHGGTAWAESRPGEGATFFFTLGNQPDPPGGAGA